MRQDSNNVQIGIEQSFLEDVVQMIEALDAYLNSLYPNHAHYLVSVDSLKGKNVKFLVARVDGQATGCGAILLDDPGYAEIKRIYVKAEARRLGIGVAILQELERQARNENRARILLETGIHQPEALALYMRAGYVERGPFGGYPLDPLSVFMEKDL